MFVPSPTWIAVLHIIHCSKVPLHCRFSSNWNLGTLWTWKNSIWSQQETLPPGSLIWEQSGNAVRPAGIQAALSNMWHYPLHMWKWLRIWNIVDSICSLTLGGGCKRRNCYWSREVWMLWLWLGIPQYNRCLCILSVDLLITFETLSNLSTSNPR